MTKQEILDYFKDINEVYNDCTRLDSLARMLNEVTASREWIPVSERLPEDGERVLAITESGNQFVGFHTQFSGWHFEYVIHPTHWMPLPEPPKDGDVDG